MSNEAFREFLKRDRLPQKSSVDRTKLPKASLVNIPTFPTNPKQSVEALMELISDPSACIVKIRNRLPSKLTHPQFYCCYGNVVSPPEDVGMGSSATFAFSHTSPLVSGLFSYRIRDKFLWVMYSTYEERNFFSMAIAPAELVMGVEMFVTMAKKVSKPEMKFGWAKNGVITIQSENILVSGQMSGDAKSILEIETSSALALQ